MKKAAKGAALQVVTANALQSGAVVFRTPGGSWSPDIAEAAIVDAQASAEVLLAAAEADAHANRIVEPYLVDVMQAGGRIRPVRLRELIRALGPTVDAPGNPDNPPARFQATDIATENRCEMAG